MNVSYNHYKDQLDYLYQLVQNSLRVRSTIRSWCITIWSAIVVVGITQNIENKTLFWILFAEILFFWIADSVERAREYLHRDQIIGIEEDIVSGKSVVNSANEFFALSGYDKNMTIKKLKYCIKSFLTAETIYSFYPLFILMSLAFVNLI